MIIYAVLTSSHILLPPQILCLHCSRPTLFSSTRTPCIGCTGRSLDALASYFYKYLRRTLWSCNPWQLQFVRPDIFTSTEHPQLHLSELFSASETGNWIISLKFLQRARALHYTANTMWLDTGKYALGLSSTYAN